MTKIVLIGFMGSGKTSLAKILANYLDLDVYELDQIILAKTEFASIPELFQAKGENYFRELEAQTCLEIAEVQDGVISCGGGVVNRTENMLNLLKGNKDSHCVYLDTSFDEIKKRIGTEANDRPLFADILKAQDLHQVRKTLYEKYATFVLNTDGKTLDYLAVDLIKRLGI